MNQQPIAYLCSEYPAISHTFIHREIETLRQSGMTVHTASIHEPTNTVMMTPEEQREAANTLKVLSSPLSSMLKAHLHCALNNPQGYLRMAAAAAWLLVRGPRNPVKAAAYFVEAGILLEWVKGLGVTHIHEHFGNPTAFVAMLMKRYGGISFSVSIHGPDIFDNVEPAMLPDKVAQASFVRCISHYCKSQIMRISPPERWSDLHIVRCGVDPSRYEPRPDPGNTVPNLLCVGRLVPAKGQHLLIEACALLKEKGVEFELTIVGDGPDRTSLERLVSRLGLDGLVTFTGALGQDKVHDEYDKADIFVLGSFAEGVPVVLMEAMAKAIPVVSTRITGIPELVEHGRSGLLATPGNVGELSMLLGRLIADSELRRRLGAAGRETVADRYNQQVNNSEMANLFNAVSYKEVGYENV